MIHMGNTSDGKPVAWGGNLPAKDYPFTIEIFRVADKRGLNPIHKEVVERPAGGLVSIAVPGLREKYGPNWTRIIFGDGRVEEAWPDE